jgi:hypothetical protein
MSRTVFKLVSPAPAFDCLPIRIEQAPAGSAFSRLLLLLPAVVAMTALLAGVAIAAVDEPAMLDALARRPLASMQIAAGLVLWTALFVVPASRAITTLWRHRMVSIGHGMVEISDRRLMGMRVRQMPLSAYSGVAHHIRASLSGLTHEIVLVHADPALTVTLASGEHVTQGVLDAARSLLRLPEVPPRALYERRAGWWAGEGSQSLEPARA